MKQKVYFAGLEAGSNKDSILKKTGRLIDALYGEKQFFSEGQIVGVKAHFGEYGLATFLRPVFARTAVEKIKEKGGIPFLFDTTTLYTSGVRANAPSHIAAAVKNGFAYAVTGAPVVIIDGVRGYSQVEVEINARHFKKVKLAGDLPYIDAVVCLSHFKGHCAAGFGGALKAVSMGMASRAGKLQMHSSTKPFINNKCTACGICIGLCPVYAIGLKGDKAEINEDICIGCMECDTRCPKKAIKFRWDNPENVLMERMAEYAAGVLKMKGKNIVYLNFLLDITPDCDCYGYSNAPVCPDIGVLASGDPVAADQASADMVNKHGGKDVFREIWPKADYGHMLDYCEKLGIGHRKYTLIKI